MNLLNKRIQDTHMYRNKIRHSISSTCIVFPIANTDTDNYSSYTISDQDKVDRNNVLFTRNNVISDTIEKLTNCPYIFDDEELEDYDILKNNKELAMMYAIIIIALVLYIIILDNIANDD